MFGVQPARRQLADRRLILVAVSTGPSSRSHAIPPTEAIIFHPSGALTSCARLSLHPASRAAAGRRAVGSPRFAARIEGAHREVASESPSRPASLRGDRPDQRSSTTPPQSLAPTTSLRSSISPSNSLGSRGAGRSRPLPNPPSPTAGAQRLGATLPGRLREAMPPCWSGIMEALRDRPELAQLYRLLALILLRAPNNGCYHRYPFWYERWSSLITPPCRCREDRYYGPGLCGKRPPSLTSTPRRRRRVAARWSPGNGTDRTSFRSAAIDVGVIGGFKTRLQLYTSGQCSTTRRASWCSKASTESSSSPIRRTRDGGDLESSESRDN